MNCLSIFSKFLLFVGIFKFFFGEPKVGNLILGIRKLIPLRFPTPFPIRAVAAEKESPRCFPRFWASKFRAEFTRAILGKVILEAPSGITNVLFPTVSLLRNSAVPLGRKLSSGSLSLTRFAFALPFAGGWFVFALPFAGGWFVFVSVLAGVWFVFVFVLAGVWFAFVLAAFPVASD